MGMFDYVKVHEKHGIPSLGYQSKDFDCELTMIRITESGRLEIERFEYESGPKVNTKWEDLNYHGMFNFYGNDGEGFEGEWFDFVAKFTDGNLVEIKRVSGTE